MNSLDVFLKTPWFSSPCEWFRFACQRNLKSFRMTSWPRLPLKVHLRRKVKYWKCHFLSALHFPEIEGSRFETCRLCRFFSNPWVPIKKKKQWKSTDNNQKSIKAYESMKIKGNRGNSWSPNSLSATSYKQQATSYRLQTSVLKACFTNMICWISVATPNDIDQRCYLCCGRADGNGRDSPSQYIFQLR